MLAFYSMSSTAHRRSVVGGFLLVQATKWNQPMFALVRQRSPTSVRNAHRPRKETGLLESLSLSLFHCKWRVRCVSPDRSSEISWSNGSHTHFSKLSQGSRQRDQTCPVAFCGTCAHIHTGWQDRADFGSSGFSQLFCIRTTQPAKSRSLKT